MKRGKFILTAMVVVAAIGSAFAVNAKMFNPASVYYKPAGSSTYTLIPCTSVDIATPQCSYQVTRNSAYFTSTAPGVYQVIDNGITLHVPNAQ